VPRRNQGRRFKAHVKELHEIGAKNAFTAMREILTRI
jgi:hypothetical protein